MVDLKTNYVDDVLDTSVNVKRKYNMIQNADGTVSFDDVTTYTQNGDSFGAKDINDTNAAVNELNSNLNECIQGFTSPKDLKMFAAFTTISSAPANSYYEKNENLETYLPPNAKIIFGVASILGPLTPYLEVSGTNVRLYDDYPKSIGFRIYNHLSYPINLKIAYICFYTES